MNAEEWHNSEICIAINDESQGNIAKNLRCDEFLYYTFITHSAGERIFKIGAFCKVTGKIVGYVIYPIRFALLSSNRSRQISLITCVLQTKTVIKRCYVNRQINVS